MLAPGMEGLSADVFPVGNNVGASESLPTLSHNGTKYIVANPGMEWKLRVKVLNSKRKQRYRVRVKLDGKDIGYALTAECMSSVDCSFVLPGFAHTEPRTRNIHYKAFKFAPLQPAAGAATVEHPDQIQAGRIEVTCEAVVLVGKRDSKHQDVNWATDAASKKLPEGKKWFLQPGLQAAAGSTVTPTNHGWERNQYAVVHTLPVLKLRYDTADNLRLRKILDPSKPQHAAILARGGSAAGSSMAGNSSRVKPERRTAGVERERSADQQQRGQQAVAGGADVELPRSATAETINLVDDGPAPLRVGGRALAADELAVCDLAGSDDEDREPSWQVHKKPAVELAV